MKKCLLGATAVVLALGMLALVLVVVLFPRSEGVDGYVDQASSFPGDTAKVYVSSREDSIAVRLFNVAGDIVDHVRIDGGHQTISAPEPWRNGFGWDATFEYPIDLPSGIYLWENTIPMVIKSSADDLDLLVVYPSNTIAAYNRAGGRSL